MLCFSRLRQIITFAHFFFSLEAGKNLKSSLPIESQIPSTSCYKLALFPAYFHLQFQYWKLLNDQNLMMLGIPVNQASCRPLSDSTTISLASHPGCLFINEWPGYEATLLSAKIKCSILIVFDPSSFPVSPSSHKRTMTAHCLVFNNKYKLAVTFNSDPPKIGFPRNKFFGNICSYYRPATQKKISDS